jgi:Ca2+/Na+ antiporter
VVVIASVARNRSSLAIGNVVGSAMSNILGAFSLGLLLHPGGQDFVFDRSSRIYSLLLLVLTLFVTLVAFLRVQSSWKILGDVLLALFVIYVVSVGWGISRGAIAAPELSDSDDDSSAGGSESPHGLRRPFGSSTETEPLLSRDLEAASTSIIANSAPAPPAPPALPAASHDSRRRIINSPTHCLIYHIVQLLVGFICICLAGYVLSHSATTISDELGISDVLFGVVILSVATTLPEKFIAVLSGSRGHEGILVANTIGSNIFLLSLCMGIVLVASGGDFDRGSVNAAELGVMISSTVVLTATVWFGARWSRWIGAGMLVAYAVFLVLEFTTIRKIG